AGVTRWNCPCSDRTKIVAPAWPAATCRWCVLPALHSRLRIRPKTQSWVGRAAGPDVEPVAVPRAPDAAVLDGRIVERTAEVRTDGRVPQPDAVHLDFAHSVRQAAVEQGLAAHHHRLVLIPEERVEPDVKRTQRLDMIRRDVRNQKLDGDARVVGTALLQAG